MLGNNAIIMYEYLKKSRDNVQSVVEEVLHILENSDEDEVNLVIEVVMAKLDEQD